MSNVKKYYIYILASGRNGTLYIGITSDLTRRIEEHKAKILPGFTSKYEVNKLVYYEEYDDVGIAIQREKRLKEWQRAWKLRLIEKKILIGMIYLICFFKFKDPGSRAKSRAG